MIARDADYEAGFSLVEMLVGLILISILIASLTSLAGQFRGLISVTDETIERAALDATVRRVSEILEQAETLPVEFVEGGLLPFLKGTKSDVQLVSTASLGLDDRGLRTVTISRNDVGELILGLQFRRSPLSTTQKDGPIVLVVNEAVSGVQFSYFGRSRDDEKLEWSDEWSRLGGLPLAISTTISVEIDSGKTISASSIASLQGRDTNY